MTYPSCNNISQTEKQSCIFFSFTSLSFAFQSSTSVAMLSESHWLSPAEQTNWPQHRTTHHTGLKISLQPVPWIQLRRPHIYLKMIVWTTHISYNFMMKHSQCFHLISANLLNYINRGRRMCSASNFLIKPSETLSHGDELLVLGRIVPLTRPTWVFRPWIWPFAPAAETQTLGGAAADSDRRRGTRSPRAPSVSPRVDRAPSPGNKTD